jgi:hypothetical protein
VTAKGTTRTGTARTGGSAAFSTRRMGNRSLTAAAQILNGPKAPPRAGKRSGKGQAWQQDAWGFYDLVGEFNYLVEWQARLASRIRLVAARELPGADEPEIIDGQDPDANDDAQGSAVSGAELDENDRIAAELVADFAGGQSGREQLIYRASVQIQVTGESYVIGRAVSERWDAYSNEEVSNTGTDRWKVDDGVDKFELTDSDPLIRVWRPHGRRRADANSAAKSLLPVLAEIKGLTAQVLAQIDSRLSGAGLLILPQSMTFSSAQPQDGDGGDGGDTEDPFVRELIEVITTSLRDDDSAARVVPIVIKVPDESIGKVQYLRFDAPADAKIKEVLAGAIERLARGYDAPPEALLGNSEANHWSAWRTSEDIVTASIAPLVAIICHALTIGWYRPALAELGVENADEYSVWFDATPIIVRPDRTEAARELYDRQELSGEALRRESNFDEADAPQDQELVRQVLLQLLRTKPDMAATILPLLTNGAQALPLPPAPGEAAPAEVESGSGPDGPPNPADAQPGTQGPPDQVAASAGQADTTPDTDCLVTACHLAVIRALEVAGKRMLTRQHRGQLKDVPPHELHTHLPVDDTDLNRLTAGAWDTLHTALPDHPGLVADLDEYVRSLLVAGQPHERRYLPPILSRCQECAA